MFIIQAVSVWWSQKKKITRARWSHVEKITSLDADISPIHVFTHLNMLYAYYGQSTG